MYAVVDSGGKQYRVEEGSEIVVDRLRAEKGDKVTLRPVMFKGEEVVVGAKELGKIKVEATVTEHLRGEKIKVFKYKAKKGYSRRAGHRSELTRLEITSLGGGVKKAAPKQETAKKAESKPKAAEKAATEPKAPAKPRTAAKAGKAPAKPKAETKPKAAAKPKAETKPKATAKPKAAAKPKTESKAAAKPAAKTAKKPGGAKKENSDGS